MIFLEIKRVCFCVSLWLIYHNLDFIVLFCCLLTLFGFVDVVAYDVGGASSVVGGWSLTVDKVDNFADVGVLECDVAGNASIVVCVVEIDDFMVWRLGCTMVGEFDFCIFVIFGVDDFNCIGIIVSVMFSLCYSKRIINISFCSNDTRMLDVRHFKI